MFYNDLQKSGSCFICKYLEENFVDLTKGGIFQNTTNNINLIISLYYQQKNRGKFGTVNIKMRILSIL